MNLRQTANALEQNLLDVYSALKTGDLPYTLENGRAEISQLSIDAIIDARSTSNLNEIEPSSELPVEEMEESKNEQTNICKKENENTNKDEEKPIIQFPTILPDYDIVKEVVGDTYQSLCNTFGDAQLRKTIGTLKSALTVDEMQSLYKSDNGNVIFKQNEVNLHRYMTTLAKVGMLIEEKFSQHIPSQYDIFEAPKDYLPHRIHKTVQKLESIGKYNPLDDATAISNQLEISLEITKGLIEEGADVPYFLALHSGLKLDTNEHFVGGRNLSRNSFTANAERACKRWGFQYNPKRLEKEERRLSHIILYDGGKGNAMSLHHRGEVHLGQCRFIDDTYKIIG